ncbi:MAG TPA: class I SAM-dependent methyltransferase [Caulobacteraceae bacterium]|nr:class I SAM-dependent methyltransferase [Caulobacteraceae bacterium]
MKRGLAGYDAKTLAFYEREAAIYTGRPAHAGGFPWLWRFLEELPRGAAILELGCGGGRDAQEMIRLGYAVTPTDGSPAMAAEAERRLGRPVRVMRFEELGAEAAFGAAFDAVWANATLLHVRAAKLPSVLAAVRGALKPGGRFFASYKLGAGEGRDRFGRYYNFPTEAALLAAYATAGPWASLDSGDAIGAGYDGVTRNWMMLTVTRPSAPGS